MRRCAPDLGQYAMPVRETPELPGLPRRYEPHSLISGASLAEVATSHVAVRGKGLLPRPLRKASLNSSPATWPVSEAMQAVSRRVLHSCAPHRPTAAQQPQGVKQEGERHGLSWESLPLLYLFCYWPAAARKQPAHGNAADIQLAPATGHVGKVGENRVSLVEDTVS